MENTDLKTDKKIFMKTISAYLKVIEITPGRQNQANICTCVFDYIIVNKHLLDGMVESFKGSLLSKLLEFKKDCADCFDSDKYMKILFPDYVMLQPPVENPISKLIFEDYKLNKFIDLKVLCKTDNVLEKIVQDVTTKYPSCDATLIMWNIGKTIDQIKNDKEYNGPFLIKLEPNFYELYEKQTDIITRSRYIYTSTFSEVVVNKVGRYAQLY